MGINRYQAWKVALACWMGSAVMFLVLAYLGHYGLGSILRYSGISKSAKSNQISAFSQKPNEPLFNEASNLH